MMKELGIENNVQKSIVKKRGINFCPAKFCVDLKRMRAIPHLNKPFLRPLPAFARLFLGNYMPLNKVSCCMYCLI